MKAHGNSDLRRGEPASQVHYQTLSGKDLPMGFQFSQGSLQDFVECRRRFQLRYIWRLAWPAIESEPVLESEQRMRQGALFHHMVQQHLAGVPLERLSGLISVQDENLRHWWDNYINHFPDLEGLRRFAGLSDLTSRSYEISLSAPLAGYRLLAKYDLILTAKDGRMVIIDWKTSTSNQPPRRQWLAERLQTRVYPYILARAGHVLWGGQAIQPAGISMLYWYVNYPEEALRFLYDAGAFQEDQVYLENLAATILRLGADEFPLAEDERRCAYCVYRSLCNRGISAGILDEGDVDDEIAPDLTFDFEQIAEIAF